MAKLIIINDEGCCYDAKVSFATPDAAWAWLQKEFPNDSLENLQDGFTLATVEDAHRYKAFDYPCEDLNDYQLMRGF